MLDESLFSNPVQFKARCYLDSHNLETMDAKFWAVGRRISKSYWKKQLPVLLPNPYDLDDRWWGTNCTSSMWTYAEKLHPNALVAWCYLLTKQLPYDCLMAEFCALLNSHNKFSYCLSTLKEKRLIAYVSKPNTGITIKSVSKHPMEFAYHRRRCLGLE